MIDLDADVLMTTNQAAKLLRVHLATVYRWVLSGKLPAWKRGGRLVVRRADLDGLLTPVVPLRERPRPGPSAKEQRAADAWTERVLREAGIL
jgi:excisionase family DNA binding protein